MKKLWIIAIALLYFGQAHAQNQGGGVNVAPNSPRFAAALKPIFNGIATGVPARICTIGDSTTFGNGSNATSPNGLNLYSWPTQLALALMNYGIPAHQDGAIGDQGSAQTLANDNRWTIGGAWTQVTGQESIGGAQLQATTNTNSLTFAPIGGVDTFRVFYVASPGAGQIGWQIDGGGFTTVSEAGPAGLAVFTVAAGASGTHTIGLQQVSGTVNVQGVEGFSQAFPAVSIVNAGWAATSTSNWAVQTNPQSPGNVQPWQILGCTVALVQLGINDEQLLNGISSPSQTLANIQTIVNALHGAGSDVLVATPNPIATGVVNQATQLTYMNAVKQAAAFTGAPAVSFYDKFFSLLNMQNNGLDYDNLHPSRTGYGDMSETYAAELVPPVYAGNLFGQLPFIQSNVNQYSYLSFSSALTSASGAPDASITRNGSSLVSFGNGTRGDKTATIQFGGEQIGTGGSACKSS